MVSTVNNNALYTQHCPRLWISRVLTTKNKNQQQRKTKGNHVQCRRVSLAWRSFTLGVSVKSSHRTP